MWSGWRMSNGSRAPRSRLRVAQLIETVSMGGAERLAVQIANARAEAGDASHLIVLTGPGSLSERISPRVATRYLHYERASLANPLRFAASVWRGASLLTRQLRADAIDVAQTHLPGANFWGLLLAWRGLCAVIPTVHNNQEFNYGREDQRFRAWARRWAYRQLLRRCPATVAVSASVRDSLVADLGAPEAADRVRVVTNGVIVPDPVPAEMLRAARARYGLPDSDPLVLAAGRLSEQKNFAMLLEATARLRASGGPRFRVLIAGDGPLRAYLTRRCHELGLDDQVVMPGSVNDLQDLMLGADLFVLPSLWEGLPLVLLEAMACGLPVIGTRIKGIAEVMDEEVNGLLCEPGDVAGLAAAMRRLLQEPALRAAYGAAGREIVRRHYDFARVSQTLGALYAEVAAAR